MTVRRAGFTLVEVITAITLTAIVLTIAAAALGAATTARERVSSHQQTLESEARVQALLTDMLRHAPGAIGTDAPLLRIAPAPNASAELVFLSTGVHEPFGTGAPWRVTVSTDANGLVVNAQPLDRRGAIDPGTPALHARVPSVRRLDVRVREPERSGEVASWRTDWPDALSRPSMIELRFDNAAGSAPNTMRVALDPFTVVR